MAEVDLKTKLTRAPKITFTGAVDGAIRLKWTKVPLAEKYDIRRSNAPDGEFIRVDWATETEFTDATAEKNRTYWYKVVAWKRMEAKKTSQKASGLCMAVVSDIPCVSGLEAHAKEGDIHLKWQKNEADKYYIYRRSDHFSRFAFIGESTKHEFVDSRAVSGQIYHYCIQSIKTSPDGVLHGNFSETADCAFIDKTEILSARALFGSRAFVEARVVAGADGYIFERSDKKDGSFTEVGRTDDITAVSFEEKLPSRFRSYYYRVCAYKKAGDKEYKGDWSAIKSVR